MTVSQMLQNMTSYELSEWMAYYKIKNEIINPQKQVNTGEVLKAMFAHKIKRA